MAPLDPISKLPAEIRNEVIKLAYSLLQQRDIVDPGTARYQGAWRVPEVKMEKMISDQTALAIAIPMLANDVYPMAFGTHNFVFASHMLAISS